jgi:ribonucleoside-diphosphate reductase alpha chain
MLGTEHGYRNAQVTVLAPTGTIAFLMDCDTTGVEPDIALVKYKLLAGGGSLKFTNTSVSAALTRLGYSLTEVAMINAYIAMHDTVEDVDGEKSPIRTEHLAVFDCAFRPAKGKRSISWTAHLKMMSAVQPFISGAISKTVNMPSSATVEEIKSAYVAAWKMGLKCVAIYRDGSKRSQPLNTKTTKKDAAKEATPQRTRMPATRRAITHKFEIAGHEGYLTVGFFDDGKPGELFVQMAKEGSTIGGLMDTIGTLTSIALQYGVPLETLVEKFSYQRFEPSGFTKHPEIKQATSVIDYVFRWMRTINTLIPSEEIKKLEVPSDGTVSVLDKAIAHFQQDAPACSKCGHIVVRNGSCYKCNNCGESMGCS